MASRFSLPTVGIRVTTALWFFLNSFRATWFTFISMLRISLITILSLTQHFSFRYMLNPFLIVACVAMTTVVFQNLFLCLLFYHTVRGNWNDSCVLYLQKFELHYTFIISVLDCN